MYNEETQQKFIELRVQGFSVPVKDIPSEEYHEEAQDWAG